MVWVFNPTDSDFHFQHGEKKYTIPSMSSIKVEKHIADLASESLARFILKKEDLVTKKEMDKVLNRIRLYD